MIQYKFDAFDTAQPLSPGATTIAQALLCEELRVRMLPAPTAEESGAALIAETDLRNVRNVHLAAKRIRFSATPADEDAMRQRIEWMLHTGSNSCDPEIASRAKGAIDVMAAQLAPEGEMSPDKEAEPQQNLIAQACFDPETLAEGLAAMARNHPELVGALFRGDLDDVPDLIDEAVNDGAVRTKLAGHAAWMFMCWGALEQQREACLGWRLVHKQLDVAWAGGIKNCWTIGQIFGPKIDQHTFAHEMKQLYSDNIEHGIDKLKDKRTINRIERTLQKLCFNGINRNTEKEIISRFGEHRIHRIPALLRHHAKDADAYNRRYRHFLTRPGGTSRAGQHADMLSARISAVHRTAIVCARTFHLARLAAKAQTTNDLRAMLDARRPAVLRPCSSKRRKDWEKSRLRQLFHVVRIEFLLDGEHLPKALKGVVLRKHHQLPLELDEQDDRRGHEIFDECWSELNDQPAGWRFITPFGWECDGLPRIRLSAVS